MINLTCQDFLIGTMFFTLVDYELEESRRKQTEFEVLFPSVTYKKYQSYFLNPRISLFMQWIESGMTLDQIVPIATEKTEL